MDSDGHIFLSHFYWLILCIHHGQEGLSNSNRLFAKFSMIADAYKMIVIHTHKEALPQPSYWDNYQTANLRKSLEGVGIDLLNYFIIGEQVYWSYRVNRKLC